MHIFTLSQTAKHRYVSLHSFNYIVQKLCNECLSYFTYSSVEIKYETFINVANGIQYEIKARLLY